MTTKVQKNPDFQRDFLSSIFTGQFFASLHSEILHIACSNRCIFWLKISIRFVSGAIRYWSLSFSNFSAWSDFMSSISAVDLRLPPNQPTINVITDTMIGSF